MMGEKLNVLYKSNFVDTPFVKFHAELHANSDTAGTRASQATYLARLSASATNEICAALSLELTAGML